MSRQSGFKEKHILQPAILYQEGKQVLNRDIAHQCWDGTYKPPVITTTKQSPNVAQKLKNDIDRLPDDEIPEFNDRRQGENILKLSFQK